MSELLVEASRESIPEVFAFLKNQLATFECPKKIQRQLKLCVDEIFTNIVSYA